MLRPYNTACTGGVMRIAPEGWPFILPGWALVLLGAWVARGAPWVWGPETALFLLAASDKASLDNEQTSVGVRTTRGPVLVRQIAGLIARRIVTDGTPGEQACQGERLGMIRFGSRVDLFLPNAARAAVRVAVGERVRAGATLLAEYGPGAGG